MFKAFRDAVNAQFNKMTKHPVFTVNIDKETMWELYLESFPAGTDPMYRERTQHNCSCCKQFVRALGNVVALIDGEIVSIWDIEETNTFYDAVAKAMATTMKNHPITNVFRSCERSVGIKENFELDSTGSTITYEHFYAKIPSHLVLPAKDFGQAMNEFQVSWNMIRRACTELSPDALSTVIDLCEANQLYRGEENLPRLKEFRDVQDAWMALPDENHGVTNTNGDLFFWEQALTLGNSVCRIKNSAVGSLMESISGGQDVERAVAAYEAMVAPGNYKRSTKIATPRMIKKAGEEVEALGYTESLPRRHAAITDITINNVLFADRQAKANMTGNPFTALAAQVAASNPDVNRAIEIGIEDFLASLPGVESIELLLENRHENNLMSLIAPVNPNAKNMLAWDNNFSWTYNGNLTDSIKERVKAAGGAIVGDLRCSLSWFNHDDLDIHMVEPDGNRIYFENRGQVHRSSGKLDVDMNASSHNLKTDPVENIVYSDKTKMPCGVYKLVINNYYQRTRDNGGFEVEVEFGGQTFNFFYDRVVRNTENIRVADITVAPDGSMTLKPYLPTTQAPKDVWGVSTQQFHRVATMMLSPNRWDGQTIGNKHYMFMLDGCTNPEPVRGFFNEFLSPELRPHRKVMEMLSDQMKASFSPDQLSGVGFSSTMRNSVVCRVNGTKLYKVTF